MSSILLSSSLSLSESNDETTTDGHSSSASKVEQSNNTNENTNTNDSGIMITDLARYAVKGLLGDPLSSVWITKTNNDVQTFPDDRRYALLKAKNRDKFDERNPEWLHKNNFLCAFSAPELLSSFHSTYEIVEAVEAIEAKDAADDDDDETSTTNTDGTAKKQKHTILIKRLLTLYRNPRIRSDDDDDSDSDSEDNNSSTKKLRLPVLGPIDLNLQSGRDELAAFFSTESKEQLVCVTKKQQQPQKGRSSSSDNTSSPTAHTFQFGNTRAGVKNNPQQDTRTVHLVNRNTIRDFSTKLGGKQLTPMRFRPNIIIDGLEAWKEFEWIGRTLRVVQSSSSLSVPTSGDGSGSNSNSSSSSSSSKKTTTTLLLKILSKTVRCEGVGIDPMDRDREKLDIPKLLTQHYPEHGPYLGVYASLEVVINNDDDDDDDSDHSNSNDDCDDDIGILLSIGDTFELL